MIVIDGREAELKLSSFENLQEVLIKVMEDDSMKQRIITDVFVNKEHFSEIYPHQAEDIETGEIEHLEIQSVTVNKMARDISEELSKVAKIVNNGAKEIAAMFRRADDSEALELLQDLLDVTRNFLGTIALLRSEYVGVEEIIPDFVQNVENLSDLLSEMNEVLENEDWVLLSDLLEYEFLPLMNNWEKSIDYIKSNIPD